VDKWHEQTAAYALGGLSTAERAEFEAHLLGCAECAAEVRAFAQAAAALAYAAPPRAAPPGLRQRVIDAAVRATGDARVTASTPAAVAPIRPVPWTWLLAAASLTIAVGLGAYSVGVRRASSEAETVVVVLGASDLVRVEMAGQPVAPRASARAFWSQSRGLVFTASNLPALPSGRTYQLWIVTGDAPIGAGLLKPRADGIVHAVFAAPSDRSKAVAIAVTIEPEGGVPAPTGDKYLVGLVN
jgi:anti-sigma-K factor RskA